MPRHRLKVAVWLTLLAVPFLVVDNIPRTAANASANVVTAAAPSSTPSTAPSATYPAPTEPPATVAPPTTAAPPAPTNATVVTAKKAVTPTTAAPTTVVTTTTAPPPPPAAAPPANMQDGAATWYDYRPGECAHQTLPMGTAVRITSQSSGLSTTCVVTDRGPFGAGRIIDLDRVTFAQLADPSVGVIAVRITW